MACKRSGVRSPLAPPFPPGKSPGFHAVGMRAPSPRDRSFPTIASPRGACDRRPSTSFQIRASAGHGLASAGRAGRERPPVTRAVDLADLAAALAAAQGPARRIVAVAGAPGSGKSAFADRLRDALVPGDGRRGAADGRLPLRRRRARGARPPPAQGGAAHLRRRRPRGDARPAPADDGRPVAVPVFDRAIEVARAGARIVPASTRLVIVEGNYLLLDHPDWARLRPSFDATVFLRVPEACSRPASRRGGRATASTPPPSGRRSRATTCRTPASSPAARCRRLRGRERLKRATRHGQGRGFPEVSGRASPPRSTAPMPGPTVDTFHGDETCRRRSTSSSSAAASSARRRRSSSPSAGCASRSARRAASRGEQSSRNWGWVRISRRDPREVPLMAEALRLWRGMDARLGRPTGYVRSGIVFTCADEAELAAAEGWARALDDYQIAHRMLSPGGIRRRWCRGRGSRSGARSTPSTTGAPSRRRRRRPSPSGRASAARTS